ncbi:MAG: hypothetical protein WBQ78_10505 [Gammaproteobacteria bacterium]
MLRGSFLVFIVGWLAWFWLDKPRPKQFRFPESGDSLVADFQHGFDMLRAGYPDMAFVYLWNAHYLILSLLGGALIAVIYGSVSDVLGRRRMRRLILPQRRTADRNGGDSAGTGPESTPSDST